jgi:hypothetical protein
MIKNIIVTMEDGTTANFIPEANLPAAPISVQVPLGVEVILSAAPQDPNAPAQG